MATKYWYKALNGSDNWSVLANWYNGSGGTGGNVAALPGIDDDVILDANSGSGTITTPANPTPAVCRSLVATTFTGTLAGNFNIQLLGSNTGLYGSGVSIELGPPGSMDYTYTGLWTIGASRGSGSINFNGQTHTGANININNGSTNFAIAQYSLANNITNTTSSVSVGGCTFNTNNYNITTPRFDIAGSANAKVINFGTSLITLTITSGACWNVSATIGSVTINGTYTIRTTGIVNSSITFIGGGVTYYNVELLRGSGIGAFVIQGSNTFINFTDNTGISAHDILFTNGTTQTFQNFNVRGASTSARVRFTSSIVGGNATLVKTGAGAVVCDYLDLGAFVTTASPANTWYAGYNSTGSGTGWVLRNPLGLLTMGVGG